MKITSVEIHPSGSSDVGILSFKDPRALNRYNVKYISGLDAEEVVRKYYGEFGGNNYYNLSLERRDIVLSIGLSPIFDEHETYSDLRDKLYKMIASSRMGIVQLQFKNGATVVAAIQGYVAKLESPQFEKTQEVHITLSCDDPMLKALTHIVVDVAGFDPANTIIEDQESTSPHGFEFDLEITADTGNLSLSDPTGGAWEFQLYPPGGFLTGDVLHVSSDYYSKLVYLTRGATVIQLADAVYPGSVWPILFPGDNHFAWSFPTNVVWDDIRYYPTYWGV